MSIEETRSLILGDTSNIGTYLGRLYDDGYLDRKKGAGRSVQYRITGNLTQDYPEFNSFELQELVQLEL